MGNQNNQWQSTGTVLEYFGKTKTEAQKKYRQFVIDGLTMGKRDDLTGGGLRRSAGGWQKVLELKKAKEYWRSDERVLGDSDFVESMLKISNEALSQKEKLKKEGWNIHKLVKRASELLGINNEDIARRGRQDNVSKARSLVAYWGRKELGLSGTELAEYFKISKQSVGESVVRGERLIRERNYNLIT